MTSFTATRMWDVLISRSILGQVDELGGNPLEVDLCDRGQWSHGEKHYECVQYEMNVMVARNGDVAGLISLMTKVIMDGKSDM